MTAEKIESMLLNSHSDLLSGGRVKGILLHMDTPGGEVSNADGIYRALLAYKKKYNVPVYAYVDGMCASGGMYIASAADKILASPSSVIGSIGVIIGPTFNFSGLMDQYGVQAMTITQGKDKDMLNPFRPWKPGEDRCLQTITADLYNQFVDIVLQARPMMDKQRLINEYGAQIYIATEAQKLGYIDDAASSYYSAIAELAKAAQIPDDHPYQVVNLEPQHLFFANFTDMKTNLLSGKITHIFQMGPYMNSELSGKFLYLYQPTIEMK
jgi:signal peptide peptidase SppA